MKNNSKTFPILKNKIEIDKLKESKNKMFEKKTFVLMVSIYCESGKCDCTGDKKPLTDYDFGDEINNWIKKHKNISKYKIGESCYEIIKNSFKHTERCPHSYYKTFCHHCPTRCYRAEEQKKIYPIMAFSGKKIMLKHPVMGIKFIKNIVQAKKIIKKYGGNDEI